MLAEGIRRHAQMPRPTASDLILEAEAEPYRQELAAQLQKMPYLEVALFQKAHQAKLLYHIKGNEWSKLYRGTRKSVLSAHRARIANAYSLGGVAHWGETKAAIREILLPRANQLLKLASVQRLLAEALARGEKVLVVGNVVFWYEDDRKVGWLVKSVQQSDSDDGTAVWEEGTIVSKNHGRIIVLPYIKEDGTTVSGHTKNAPKDGPAKPRHPDHYVDVPFKRLSGDLMIGLMGELPYE